MKNAAMPVSPPGYSNLKVVAINTGMKKGFSYRRTAIAAFRGC
jgi:hypothetical protein